MNNFLTFAAEETPSGLGAFGLNLTAFAFQLITFILVMLLLRKFVYKRLVNTLEERRKAVETSLDQAKESAEELEKTRAKVADMLNEAREEAEGIVATAHKEALAMNEDAEAKAHKKADHIVAEAKSQLDQEVAKARKSLRDETMQLVAVATEAIIKEKVDSKKDETLIRDALKEKV